MICLTAVVVVVTGEQQALVVYPQEQNFIFQI
jgi:hypothetical protein